MYSNNWSYSRNIQGAPLQRVRFRVFMKQMLVSKTYVFCKIVKGLSPLYLTTYVSLRSTFNYQTSSANKNNLQEFSCRAESFLFSLFVLENGTNQTTPYEMLNLRSTVLQFTTAVLNLLCSLLLHSFIQQSLNLGSAQVQTLLAACRRFAIVRISESGPGWK